MKTFCLRQQSLVVRVMIDAGLNQPVQAELHVPHSVVSILLELWQAWWSLPWEPVRVPNHPLDEEYFPNIQPKSHIKQLYVLSPSPKIAHQKEKISICIPTSSHEKTEMMSFLSLLFFKLNKPSCFSKIFPSLYKILFDLNVNNFSKLAFSIKHKENAVGLIKLGWFC